MIEYLLTANFRPEEKLASFPRSAKLDGQMQIDESDLPRVPSARVLPMNLSQSWTSPTDFESSYTSILGEVETELFFPELRSKGTLSPVVASKRPWISIDETQSAQIPCSKRTHTEKDNSDVFLDRD